MKLGRGTARLRGGGGNDGKAVSVNGDIVWLRDDFRLDDQPAIGAAANRPALFVHIHDEKGGGGRPLGGAAKWRLARSLAAFAAELSARGGRLDIVSGDAEPAILRLAAAANVSRVLWTRRTEGGATALDARVKTALKARGVEAQSLNGRLLREPWELAKADGVPVGVFSAFWRRHRALGSLPAPTPAPQRLTPMPWPAGAPAPTSIEALRLTPTAPDWAAELGLGEAPGEQGALGALKSFVGEPLRGYAAERDLPAADAGSRLSAHLRFGEISPRRVAHAVETAAAADPGMAATTDKFLAELGWRDFAAALLFAHPGLATRPLRPEFERFPWRDDEKDFRAWTRGRTGYPIVDAGMRQLWRTGFLPNRVRMIAASFLVKHLLIDWRRGEQWFWDTLVDADPASNPLNWQWVAGSGVDSAPYFRIFNPVLQARRFDPDGAYVRRWVPQLAQLEAPEVHAPWEASSAALARAGIVLGQTYPKPIVDHAQARARALAAFEDMRAL
jgi:deoxyribodipyrimidine photo-lyase